MFGLSKEEKLQELQNLEYEHGILSNIQVSITSDGYKEKVLDPIRDYIEQLKSAYDCKSLEELAYNKGKYEAYKEIIDLHEKIQKQKQNIEYEIENLKQG